MDALIFCINAFVDPLAQLFRGDRCWLAQNHRREWSFTPFVAGDTKHGRFAYRRMLHDDLFDILGEDIRPPLMIMSFFLSTRWRNPSASAYPTSPVCSQPSTIAWEDRSGRL